MITTQEREYPDGSSKVINADVNAAYNIIRKAILKSVVDRIEGFGLHLGSLSIKQMITSKEVCNMVNKFHNLNLELEPIH